MALLITIPANEMERDILRVKELTDKPFGVNFHMYQPNAADIVDLVIRHGVRAVSYSRSPGPEFIKKLKDEGYGRARVEGQPQGDWVLIDAGDVIVHLFRPEVRDFYNLEKMWSADRPMERMVV